MIRVEVKDYCGECCDFDADITRPEKLELFGKDGEREIILSDTIIRCIHARRCEAVKRYLERQITKGEKNERDY